MANKRPNAPRALVGNASDAEQVKRAKETMDARRNREIANQFAVLSTVAGRAEYWRLLGAFGVFKLSMAGDPYVTAFNEGRRSAGSDMLTEVTSLFPDLYLLMQREAMDAETQTDSSVGEQHNDTSPETAP